MPTAADGDAARRRERLVEVYEEASGCVKCPLSENRTRVVFGAGDADADLMFVGEAPGAEEDSRGLPFVGRAGGLLNELLAGIELSRDEVFITNTVKCRPPGNRDPRPEEIATCRPYLEAQVELIEPTVIATLGNFATKLLTGSRVGITKVRGAPQLHRLGARDVFIFPLLHPAAALRTPSLVETLREDFSRLSELIAAGPPEPETPDEPEGPTVDPGGDPADQLGLFGG